MIVKMVFQVTRGKTIKFGEYASYFRKSPGHHVDVWYFESEGDIELARKIFTLLLSQRAQCRMIQFYQEGRIPHDLTKHNFIHNGLYFTNTKGPLPIFAIPYGENQWVYMIERHKGGVPATALSYLPYLTTIEQQLTLGMSEGGMAI